VRIHIYREGSRVHIDVEDDAGSYRPGPPGTGLGMGIVDQRLRGLMPETAGLQVHCDPDRLTRVSIVLVSPADGTLGAA